MFSFPGCWNFVVACWFVSQCFGELDHYEDGESMMSEMFVNQCHLNHCENMKIFVW